MDVSVFQNCCISVLEVKSSGLWLAKSLMRTGKTLGVSTVLVALEEVLMMAFCFPKMKWQRRSRKLDMF